MVGSPRTFAAILVVLVACHGASSQTLEQRSAAFAAEFPLMVSDELNAVFAPRFNLVALFSCLQAYFPDILTISGTLTGLVADIRQGLTEFIPEFTGCSINSAGIVDDIKCRIRVVIKYVGSALDISNRVAAVNKSGRELLASISKCTAQGGPTAVPPTQPPSKPPTQPSTQPPTQPSTKPSTQPSTQPSTKPPTQPSTQPPTQPPTQPSTQPPTQPSTQPPPQPSTQPPTQPSTQPPQPQTPDLARPIPAVPEAAQPAVPLTPIKAPQQIPIFINKYFVPRLN